VKDYCLLRREKCLLYQSLENRYSKKGLNGKL